MKENGAQTDLAVRLVGLAKSIARNLGPEHARLGRKLLKSTDYVVHLCFRSELGTARGAERARFYTQRALDIFVYLDQLDGYDRGVLHKGLTWAHALLKELPEPTPAEAQTQTVPFRKSDRPSSIITLIPLAGTGFHSP